MPESDAMKALSLFAYLLLLLACYGWGLAASGRIVTGKGGFALLSVLGLAVLVFAGGILNVLHLAYPVALWLLLLAGLAMAALRSVPAVKSGLADFSLPVRALPQWLPMLVLFGFVAFYAWTLLPAQLFNFGDDMHTYMTRPVRMLQTGTLGGNPYGLLGMDTWGGQAFLHGFVLLEFPFGYLLGIDAVFGFALTGLLLAALARRYGLHWSVATFAMLAFVAINPQTVNISVLYLGSALMLGMIFASLLLLEQLDGSGHYRKCAILLGLIVAALVNLKITLVSYALAFLAVFFLCLLWLRPDRKRVLRAAGLMSLAGFVAALPWLLLHATHYLGALSISHTPDTAGAAMLSGNLAELFSGESLRYGGSFPAYGAAALALLAAAVYAISGFLPRGQDNRQRGYALVVFAAAVAGCASYLFNGIVFPATLAVRYSCPALIATFPFVLMAVTGIVSRPAVMAAQAIWPLALRGVSLGVAALVTVLFWDSLTSRIERAATQHQALSFPVNDTYVEYNRFALSPQAGQIIREIQYKLPPGEKILAWISMPYHLDFARNDIYNVMDPGMINPWLDIPMTGNPDDVVGYLKGQGVRYIMWQSAGYGMTPREKYQALQSYTFVAERKIGLKGQYLTRILDDMMVRGLYVYQAKSILLFDLQRIK